MMKPEPFLAGEIQTLSDRLGTLAHLVVEQNPTLATSLIMMAATAAIYAARAERLESELAQAQRTLRHIRLNAEEEATAAEARAREADPARAEQWQRRAAIIARMLPGGGACGRGGAA